MGQTSPDALPWPEFGDPGAVPSDMHELALAAQAALNKKAAIIGTAANLSYNTGLWQLAGGYTQIAFYAFGNIVIGTGMLSRKIAMAIVDNTRYGLGTVPVGYRPIINMKTPCSYIYNPTGTPGANVSATTIDVGADGVMEFYANAGGTMDIGHWVAINTVWRRA